RGALAVPRSDRVERTAAAVVVIGDAAARPGVSQHSAEKVDVLATAAAGGAAIRAGAPLAAGLGPLEQFFLYSPRGVVVDHVPDRNARLRDAQAAVAAAPLVRLKLPHDRAVRQDGVDGAGRPQAGLAKRRHAVGVQLLGDADDAVAVRSQAEYPPHHL